jgi:hypothetical protein
VNLPTGFVPFESAYRGPVAAQQEPSTIYWSVTDGPIVRVWDQMPDLFHDRSLLITWWREVPSAGVWVAVLVSLFALALAALLLIRALWGPGRAAQPDPTSYGA